MGARRRPAARSKIAGMRWVVLVLAGCSFNPRFELSSDAAKDAHKPDARTQDASGRDAPADAPADAVPPQPDAPPTSSVSFVQGNIASSIGGQVVLSLSQAVQDGDVCVIGVGLTGNSVSMVHDTATNTFTTVGSSNNDTIIVAEHMKASPNDSITVSFSGTSGYTAAVAVYRGLAASSPVDGSASAGGNGNTLDSGGVTTSHAHDLLVGFASTGGTITAGSGFTQDVGGMYSLIEHEEVMATATYHATAASSGPWTMWELALKAGN